MAKVVSDFRNERIVSKLSKDKSDGRSPSQRDRDRLLYSSAFRRLAEVTQVVAANSGYVFHNRLTHSLQVSQVGRRLAEKLIRENKKGLGDFGGPDPDVVEAAALAHDIGHPPFGHVVEDCLNDLAKTFGGFEGNAQSFRIVCRLAFHSPDYLGLNLTRSTLCAVLKYPWLRDTNPDKPKKWGSYLSEKNSFSFARALHPVEFEQSSEAFIMDWADDITYCVHDLEDFYRAGRIPVHLLASSESRELDYFFEKTFERQAALPKSRLLDRQEDVKDMFRKLIFTVFPAMQPYRGGERQRAGLRSFTSLLIGRYINALTVTEQNGQLRPFVAQEYRDEVAMLKELTWTYVIQEPSLATQQLGQRRMVEKLFTEYAHAALSPAEHRLFPTYYQERLKRADSDEERKRACIDLIAGMTEVQVQRVFSRISGLSADSSLVDPLA